MAKKEDACCADGCDLRSEVAELKAKLEDMQKAGVGKIGWLRLKDNRIVVALVISQSHKDQTFTVQWFGDSVLGRAACITGVKEGVLKGCFNMSKKLLDDTIRIERELGEVL